MSILLGCIFLCVSVLLFFLSFKIHFNVFYFFAIRVAPKAYESSQARGKIRATSSGLHYSHSNAWWNCICDIHLSSWEHQILNPLRVVRDQTQNLLVPSWIHFCWATLVTLVLFLKKKLSEYYTFIVVQPS